MATIDWPDPRCILCLAVGQETELGHLTDEHIVPRMLGGILTCKFLCKPCNDCMGQLESALKEDPSIRLTVEKLRTQIPDLYGSISKKQTFLAESAGGFVEGYYRRQESGAIADAKREVTAIRPKLDGRRLLTMMDSSGRERLTGAGICLLKIAFEYLALHIWRGHLLLSAPSYPRSTLAQQPGPV